MNFIFCVLGLIPMALCRDFQNFSDSDLSVVAKHLLDIQRSSMYFQIVDVIDECNLTHTVVGDEIHNLFEQNHSPTKVAKCHVDCVLRSIDVMTNTGFHEKEYIEIVKKLLSNYTRISMNKHQRSYYERAVKHLRSRYDVIQLFERAAHECIDVKDESNDNCEKSFGVAKCLGDSVRLHSGGAVDNGLFPPLGFSSIKLDSSTTSKADKKSRKWQGRLFMMWG